MSTTKWASRSEVVETVAQNCCCLLQSLSEIHKTIKLAKVRLKTNELIHNIKSFNFIFHLVNVMLQLPDLDFFGAVSIIVLSTKEIFY